MQAKMRALFTVNLAERATSGEGSFLPERDSRRRALRLHGLDKRPAHLFGRCSQPPHRGDGVRCRGSRAPATSDEGEETYEVSGEDLAAMMEAVNAGNSPESFEGNLANVDRSLVTVEVRNGSGIGARRPLPASF